MGNPNNVKLGPGLLHFAPVGTAEPTSLADPFGVAWVPVGYTEEGSTFSYELETEDVEVAEELDPIRKEPVKRTGTLAFAMAEITVANISKAFNGGTVITGARLIGTATIAASTGVFTASDDHELSVGDAVVLGAITTTTGVTAGTTYYVLTAPTATTFTLSATSGGSALSLTGDGSTASVSEVLGFTDFEPPELGAEVRTAIAWESVQGDERWFFRKCFQAGNLEIARKKAPDKATIPVEFALEKPAGAQPFRARFADEVAA